MIILEQYHEIIQSQLSSVLLKKLTMVNWKVRTENTTYLITPHKASTKVRNCF